jgi:hypothetical protein
VSELAWRRPELAERLEVPPRAHPHGGRPKLIITLVGPKLDLALACVTAAPGPRRRPPSLFSTGDIILPRKQAHVLGGTPQSVEVGMGLPHLCKFRIGMTLPLTASQPNTWLDGIFRLGRSHPLNQTLH